MLHKSFTSIISFILLLTAMPSLWGQTIISGIVRDEDSGIGMPGVNVIIEGKMSGTVTDLDGNFSIFTSEVPPFNLKFSLMGFEGRNVNVITNGQEIDITLVPITITGSQVVVTASRVEEGILRSPISIEQIDAVEIRNSPAADAYTSLANLNGVQTNTSSLTFTSVNTRGFADMQNWRFIQLLDGVEMNAPGLNYPVGALSAPSDIDIASMELVPGASSALYGANAFNGMLAIQTRSPFYSTGFSASMKGGVTMENVSGINPFGDVGFRYAHNFNDKFAFKISASALVVEDWGADDESFHITNERAVSGDVASLLSTPRDAPFYDAVNRYGDEVAVPLTLGGETVLVSRSGIAESDIIDYNQQVFKANAALHYRISDNLELSYDYRFLHGDAILRHTATYPLVNLTQHIHKLELRGGNSFFRAYYSAEDAGDSYNMLATGAYIQEGLKSTADWATDYTLAYEGLISGVTAGDHAAARAYADSDMLDASSDQFQTLRTQTLENPDVLTGGSRVIDHSSFVHAEGVYDFTPHWDVVEFQMGGSFRRYNLVSEGSLFNDNTADGFSGDIGVMEYGGYVQASKALFKDIVRLRASARLDRNQNFPLRITPRASMVISWGERRAHNLRFSYQTGFRNPATQETYIALDVGQAVLLGGVLDNINNYNYTLGADNPFTGATTGTSIDGNLIYDNLVTLNSFGAFAVTGDPTLLESANLTPLLQEQVTAFEVGYKAKITRDLYIDINGYYSLYDNFVSRVNTYSLEANRVFSVYTNITDRITSIGAGLNIEYLLPANFKLGASYNWTTFDSDNAVANNEGFLPSFNTPTHRVKASFSNASVWKGLGFSIKYRWADAYLWQSPFGQGEIAQTHIVDAAFTLKIPAINSAVKLGATNLTNQSYRQVYGGPNVGSQIYLGLTYDPVAYKADFGRSSRTRRERPDRDKNKGDNNKPEDEPDGEIPDHTRF